MTDYIYSLRCPRTGAVRYIGKTRNPKTRLASHLSRAKKPAGTHRCAAWISSLLADGLEPLFDILFEVPADELWMAYEQRFIEEHWAAGCDLVNLTGGGEGFYKPDPELLARRGRSLSRYLEEHPEAREKMSAVMQRYWSDPINHERHSSQAKVQWDEKRDDMLAAMRTPEAVQRRSEATKHRHQNPEFAAAHSARMKAIANTPEKREEASQRSLRAWADPEITERRISAIKATYSQPEMQQKMSEINREINARPEVKAVKSTKSKEQWQNDQYRDAILKNLQSPEFAAAQAERLKGRWQDPEHRQKMQDARWTPEKRREQAERLAGRQEKIQGLMTDDVIKRRNASIKAAWARRKAAKEAAD